MKPETTEAAADTRHSSPTPGSAREWAKLLKRALAALKYGGDLASQTETTDSQSVAASRALDKIGPMEEELREVIRQCENSNEESELIELRKVAHSARYILEDLNDNGWIKLARITGLPEGVIASARENILQNAELCQPCPPPTPPRQQTADGQGLA